MFEHIETDLSGKVLVNRYRLLKLIKSGGMGVVFLAEDRHLERLCAVKSLAIQQEKRKKTLKRDIERFKREAKILVDLHHNNLPRVYDYFCENSNYYLVMDYIEGDDLLTLIKRHGAKGIPEADVLEWLIEICHILNYLHNNKPPVIYRDLKPSNIMIRKKDRRVILVDFGLAILSNIVLPLGDAYMGTLGYAPQEQCNGKTTTVSDIYSFGATAYHLLTGSISNDFIKRPVKEKNKYIGEELDRIISKCLKKDQSDRYQHVEELLYDLKNYQAHLQSARQYLSATYDEPENNITVEGTYDLNREKLCEILIKCCSKGGYGKIILKDSEEEGEICFYRGNIVHARLGNLKGEKALYSFLTWKKGLAIYIKSRSDDVTIIKSSKSLLQDCLNIVNELAIIEKDIPNLDLDNNISHILPVNKKILLSSIEIGVTAHNQLSVRQVARKLDKSYYQIFKTVHELYIKNMKDCMIT